MKHNIVPLSLIIGITVLFSICCVCYVCANQQEQYVPNLNNSTFIVSGDYLSQSDVEYTSQSIIKKQVTKQNREVKSVGYLIEFENTPLSKKFSELKIKTKENSNSVLSKIPIIRNFILTEAKIPYEMIKYKSELADEHTNVKMRINNKLASLEIPGKKTAAKKEPKILSEHITAFNGVALDISAEEAKELIKVRGIKRISPNYEVKADLMDSVPLINANDVWQMQDSQGRNITGENVTIAIIDTGIDYTHPDLGGCLGEGCKVIGGYDFVNNDNDPMDDMGHGTHCAGIAAGSGKGGLKGVAPDAKLYAYKVLNSGGSGTWDQVLSGIERALDPNNDGDFSDHVDVISMSLGGSGGNPDDFISVAVDNAVNVGITAAIAAGNDGSAEETINSPGTARKAITVGASYKDDDMASFSSRGPVVWTDQNGNEKAIIKPDVVAPGVSICSAQYDSAWSYSQCFDDKHVAISGTSMATPHVAGTVALIKQAHQDWTPDEIKMALRSTSKNLGYDIGAQGYGRIDVLRAVNLIGRPAVIDFEIQPVGDRIDFLTSITGENLTNYSLQYFNQNLDSWEILARGAISSSFDGKIFSADKAIFNNGLAMFKLIVFNHKTDYVSYAAQPIENFEIEIGSNRHYLISNNEPVYVKTQYSDYVGYDLYYSYYAGNWIKLISSELRLESGKIAEINSSSFQNGKYQFKLVAKYNSNREVESQIYTAAVIKELSNGVIKIFNFSVVPESQSIIYNGDNYLFLKSEERQNLGGGWYRPIWDIKIYRGDELYKEIKDTKKEGNIYPLEGNGHWNYVVYDNKGSLNLNDFMYIPQGLYSGVLGYRVLGSLDLEGNYLNNWPYFPEYGLYETKDVRGTIYFNNDIIFNGLYQNWTALFEDNGYLAFLKSFEDRILVFDNLGNLKNIISDKVFDLGEINENTNGVQNFYNSVAFESENKTYLWFSEFKRVYSLNNIGLGSIKMKVFDLNSGELIASKTFYSKYGETIYGMSPPLIINTDKPHLAIVLSKHNDSSQDYWGGAYSEIILMDSNLNVSGKTLIPRYYNYGQPEMLIQNGLVYLVTKYYSYYDNKIIISDLNANLIRDIHEINTNMDLVGTNLITTGDIDSDDMAEIITFSGRRWWDDGSSWLRVYDFYGNLKKEFEIPTFANTLLANSLILGDYDQDGITDISLFVDPLIDLGSTFDQDNTTLFRFNLGDSKYQEKNMFWPITMHDFSNNACYNCSQQFKTLNETSNSRIENPNNQEINGKLSIYIEKNLDGKWINFMNITIGKSIDLPAFGIFDLADFFNSQNISINEIGYYRVHAVFSYNSNILEQNSEFDVV